jgi:hypothetical protein
VGREKTEKRKQKTGVRIQNDSLALIWAVPRWLLPVSSFGTNGFRIGISGLKLLDSDI